MVQKLNAFPEALLSLALSSTLQLRGFYIPLAAVFVFCLSSYRITRKYSAQTNQHF